jgi:hypothetical protein
LKLGMLIFWFPRLEKEYWKKRRNACREICSTMMWFIHETCTRKRVDVNVSKWMSRLVWCSWRRIRKNYTDYEAAWVKGEKESSKHTIMGEKS